MQRLLAQLNIRPLKLVLLALLLVLVISIVGPGNVQANPGWYNADWHYRKKITIHHVNVTANLTDFPVLIRLPFDNELANDAQFDGDDILFTAADEVTKLSHEIESFNGTTGNLTAWVKIPSLSSLADTDIYIYYGNNVTISQQDAANVWDANYRMVQHLQETSGGANAVKDSTANVNNGTDNNSPTFGAAGKIDGAIGFDGTNDYIQVADSNSLDITGNITLEAWIYPTIKDANHRRILIKSFSSWGEPYYMYALWMQSGLGFGVSNGITRYWGVYGSLSTGSWQYVAASHNGTHQKFYINGTLEATTANVSAIGTNDQPLLIGKALGASTEFGGTIDEARISSTERSADWIKTSYNNQSNPAVFFTMGTAQANLAAPTAIGGIILTVNKATILAPWIFLGLILSLAVTRIILNFKGKP